MDPDTNYPIGHRAKFKCSPLFIAKEAKSTSIEVVCTPTGEWKSLIWHEFDGCEIGCVEDEDCWDPSMRCHYETLTCEYKRCPTSIPFGNIIHPKDEDDHDLHPHHEEEEDFSFGQTVPFGIADQAVLSCHEGFRVRHPYNLVGIARANKLSVNDRHVHIQCNEVNGTANWYISYRSSTSNTDIEAPDDVVHVSQVKAVCELGCIYDTQVIDIYYFFSSFNSPWR